MTRIQRQYSLPNCTLILDGMDDVTQLNPTDLRPIMALLLNAECHIGNGYGNTDKPLVGGREFFESLVNAVSLYAQEFLSGVHLPASAYDADKHRTVQIKRLSPNQHELSYQPVAESMPNIKPEKLTLSTVQLFDLVEAIDQFVADTQTLPFWSLNLSPVAKKFAPREAISKQVIPAALGLSGLAIAAVAMFALPIPPVKQPETLKVGVNTTLTSPPPSPDASTAPPNPTTPVASPSPSNPPSNPSTPSTSQIQADLSGTKAITDPAELAKLQQQLRESLTSKIKLTANITEPLIYRVSVGQDGQIVGYQPQGDVATRSKAQTPLPDLLVVPAEDKRTEAIADYQVTFQAGNVIQIQPWGSPVASAQVRTDMTSPEPTSTASPIAGASPSPTAAPTNQGEKEITESTALEALQPKVYEQIDKAWSIKPPFNEDLRYRVQVNRDGAIVGYTPENRAARDYDNEVPLSKLNQSNGSNGETASFKVVFRPSGKLEISPWFGYNNP